MYLNGDQKAIISATGTMSAPASNLWLGARQSTNRYFNGSIDQVKIYNKALTAGEILAEYSGSSGPAAPSAPQNLQAAAGDANVSLAWTAPSDGGSPIANYNVYRNGTFANAPVQASHTDTGLANGVTYSYEVSAVNAIGEGARSNAASATPSASPAPIQLYISAKAAKDSYLRGEWLALV